MESDGASGNDGGSLKKRKASTASARGFAARGVAEDIMLPLSASKKSKRATAADNRYESEFVSVEVGLRELHKRMASSSAAPSKGARKKVTRTKATAAGANSADAKTAKSRKKLTTPSPALATPAPVPEEPAMEMEVLAKSAAAATPAKRPAKPKPAPSVLAQARVAAVQMQQERVMQRVRELRHSAESDSRHSPSLSPAIEQECSLNTGTSARVSAPSAPSTPTESSTQTASQLLSRATEEPIVGVDIAHDEAVSTEDGRQSPRGFFDDDLDDDQVFLQALEEVERKLQPECPKIAIPMPDENQSLESSHMSGDHCCQTSEETMPLTFTQVPQPSQASSISTIVHTEVQSSVASELLADYERLKRENEVLRKSNERLLAVEVPPLPSVEKLAISEWSDAPAVAKNQTATSMHHVNLNDATMISTSKTKTDQQVLGGLALDPNQVADGQVKECDELTTKDEEKDPVRGGDIEMDDDIGVEDLDDIEGDADENVKETRNSRGSTLDRGNYSQYRSRKSSLDEEDDSSFSQTEKGRRINSSQQPPRGSFQFGQSKHTQPSLLAETSPARVLPRTLPSSNSDTESDPDIKSSHCHSGPPRASSSSSSEESDRSDVEEENSGSNVLEAESDPDIKSSYCRSGPPRASSSSSSEESDRSDVEEENSGSNVLEAALRAGTGRGSLYPTTKRSTSLSVSVSTLESEAATKPSAVPLKTLPEKPMVKKRRGTKPSKDKSTLLWPILDDFYDFVLDLTPRRVLHSDPPHLQLIRAYENARVRLPMHYPGIKQYCDLQQESILEELLSAVRNSEEMSLHTTTRTRLWLTSISPCSHTTSHSVTVKKANTSSSSRSSTTLNPNVIFVESGFSGTSAPGKADFIVTFEDFRTGPNQRSALTDFVSGDVLAMRSPQWRGNDIYAFGIVLCSSVVAVGGAASTGERGGSSLNPDQLSVLLRAPADDKDTVSQFVFVMEMCLVNQKSSDWCWSLDQVHNLTTSAREYQAIKSVRFFKPETKEMLMSGIIPEIMKSEVTQIVEPRKKLTSGLLQELEGKYNQSQLQAILGAISDDSSISIIQGPPGTGKTKTILGVLNALLDGAALSASRQAQAKSRIRIGVSLEDKISSAGPPSEKKSVIQDSIRVLVAAPSNAAVDELIMRLLGEGIYDARQRKTYRPRIVRVGRPESVQQQQRFPSSDCGQHQDFARRKKWRKYASEVEEILLENLVSKHRSAFSTAKQARQTIIQNAQIVFCTLSGAGSVAMCELQSHHFDALVIDEAAQAVEASLLIPFKFQPSRVVLVGDHRQLPATVISKRLVDLGYDRSLFQRLVENGSRVFMLTQQYRMHPEISWFPSTYFYNSKLVEAPQMKEWTTRKYHAERCFSPFVFYDVLSGQQSQVSGSKSLRNVSEIECIIVLLTRLVADQYPELEWRRKIGIIAPYKQQIHELRGELQRWEKKYDKRLEIEVNTVDGFQGREKEVIIYSCVRTSRTGAGVSQAARSSRAVGGQNVEAFWADERRMNVAITRAKSSLWIIGNSTLLRQSAAWRALITHAKDSRRYVLEEDFVGRREQSPDRDRLQERSHDRNRRREWSQGRDGQRERSRERDGRRDRSRSRPRRQ